MQAFLRSIEEKAADLSAEKRKELAEAFRAAAARLDAPAAAEPPSAEIAPEAKGCGQKKKEGEVEADVTKALGWPADLAL